MSSYINFFVYTVMINLNPTPWRAVTRPVGPRLRGLYKAIFPMTTPTMKNRTTSARSRLLRPSSLPATASAGPGLLLCAAFLIRSPSSSCGGNARFRANPRHQERRHLQLSKVACTPELGSHDMVQPPHFAAHLQGDWLGATKKYCQKPLLSSIHSPRSC